MHSDILFQISEGILVDTYTKPGPSGISSYDDDNDTDVVSEVCTFNSHFNLLASQAAQPCYSRRHAFPLKQFMYDFHCFYFTIYTEYG